MFNWISRSLKIGALALVLSTSNGAVYADDVTDSISEALDFYKNGQYTEAVESLNYASQLIQQMKGQNLESYLPQPLDGWTVGKTSSQAAGTALFGGGVTAKREYTKGTSSVKVEIITDSPMLQGVMMMLSNPMFASADGGKLTRFGRQKGIFNYDPDSKSGDIKLVVANRFLISVDGKDISQKELTDYAEAIDFKKIADMP